MAAAHGTLSRYKVDGCRCRECYEAGSRWMKDYYRRTNQLTKMVRSGEPMKRGSQGGVNGGDGSARGHQTNLGVRRTKYASELKRERRKKPKVVEYDPDN